MTKKELEQELKGVEDLINYGYAYGIKFASNQSLLELNRAYDRIDELKAQAKVLVKKIKEFDSATLTFTFNSMENDKFNDKPPSVLSSLLSPLHQVDMIDEMNGNGDGALAKQILDEINKKEKQ